MKTMSSIGLLIDVKEAIEDRIEDLHDISENDLTRYCQSIFKNGSIELENALRMRDCELIYYYQFLRMVDAVLEGKIDGSKIANHIATYLGFGDTIVMVLLSAVPKKFPGDVLCKHGIWERANRQILFDTSLYWAFIEAFESDVK